MAESDDEVQSVRVELDDSSETVPAPGLTSGGFDGAAGASPTNSGGAPRWIFAVGVAVVGLLAMLFVSLRPAQDTALDGTDRGTTTTTSVAPDVVEEAAQPALGEAQSEEALGGVSPTAIETDAPIESIVSAGVGFLALTQEDGASPTILRSLDGVDWFAVDTSAFIDGGPVREQFFWLNLVRFDDLFGVVARSTAAPAEGKVFISDDGADWVDLDIEFEPDGAELSLFPIRLNADSVIGVRSGGFQGLEELVERVSTLAPPEAGVCDLILTSGLLSVPDYRVVDCRGELVGTIDESNLREGISARDLAICVLRVRDGSLPFALGEELVRRDLEPEREMTVLGRVTFTDFAINTSNGGVAVIDSGVPTQVDLGTCQEFIELPEPVDPSIVVVDAASTELAKLAFPWDVSFLDGQIPVRLVGEVGVTGRRQLVVEFEHALWGVDVETREWSGPLASTDLEPVGGFHQVGLSESGTRAYVVGGNEFVTFDFTAGADGSLQIVETIEPVGDREFRNNFTRILYADDDILFVNDFAYTWSLEAPPLPGE